MILGLGSTSPRREVMKFTQGTRGEFSSSRRQGWASEQPAPIGNHRRAHRAEVVFLWGELSWLIKHPAWGAQPLAAGSARDDHHTQERICGDFSWPATICY